MKPILIGFFHAATEPLSKPIAEKSALWAQPMKENTAKPAPASKLCPPLQNSSVSSRHLFKASPLPSKIFKVLQIPVFTSIF
jgi:hypothetical protein